MADLALVPKLVRATAVGARVWWRAVAIAGVGLSGETASTRASDLGRHGDEIPRCISVVESRKFLLSRTSAIASPLIAFRSRLWAGTYREYPHRMTLIFAPIPLR